jgi:hypothetical protein
MVLFSVAIEWRFSQKRGGRFAAWLASRLSARFEFRRANAWEEI